MGVLGRVDLLINIDSGMEWKNGGLLFVLDIVMFILVFVDLGLFVVENLKLKF